MTRDIWLIGNWKMNGDLALLERFEEALLGRFGRGQVSGRAKLALALPDLLLYPARGILSGTAISLGLQTCGAAATGAHTGETSPVLAQVLGACFVLLGHSERRINQAETCDLIRCKAEVAQAAGLLPVICVGETSAERKAGEAIKIVLSQVRDSCPEKGSYLIAYEPVWAIGTGQGARPEQAQDMHAAIRSALPDSNTPILYGGSMDAMNAGELLAQPDIDGGLVGGASLTPEDFLAIYEAAS